MNVIVFGATGTVGRLAVEQLLGAGHSVTAFARHPERLAIDHPALARVAGDALSAADVAAAMPGHDAAVVVLGAGASRRSTIRSEGTLNVIRAMQETGIRRLVVQSTLGARDSWGTLNFWWKRVMFGALLAPVFRDHELEGRMVAALEGRHRVEVDVEQHGGRAPAGVEADPALAVIEEFDVETRQGAPQNGENP